VARQAKEGIVRASDRTNIRVGASEALCGGKRGGLTAGLQTTTKVANFTVWHTEPFFLSFLILFTVMTDVACSVLCSKKNQRFFFFIIFSLSLVVQDGENSAVVPACVMPAASAPVSPDHGLEYLGEENRPCLHCTSSPTYRQLSTSRRMEWWNGEQCWPLLWFLISERIFFNLRLCGLEAHIQSQNIGSLSSPPYPSFFLSFFFSFIHSSIFFLSTLVLKLLFASPLMSFPPLPSDRDGQVFWVGIWSLLTVQMTVRGESHFEFFPESRIREVRDFCEEEHLM
jgi:hypothetical protein